MKYHLMTMGLNSVDPHYHGLVEIDKDNYLSDGTPVEDFGCFYYSLEKFPIDQESMFNKFLSLMD